MDKINKKTCGSWTCSI